MNGSSAEIRLLRIREVEKRVGLKRSSIYKMMTEGRFPKNVRIGKYAVAWRTDKIDQFIDECTAADR